VDWDWLPLIPVPMRNFVDTKAGNGVGALKKWLRVFKSAFDDKCANNVTFKLSSVFTSTLFYNTHRDWIEIYSEIFWERHYTKWSSQDISKPTAAVISTCFGNQLWSDTVRKGMFFKNTFSLFYVVFN
jgi:hypothetical protein